MTGRAAPRQLVAIDLGGTNVRFAIAAVADGKVRKVGEPVTLKSGDYDGLPAAWADYARRAGIDLPNAAAISVAGPVVDGEVGMTNLPWQLRRDDLQRKLGLAAVVLINDLEAVGHAVAQLPANNFTHLCGPQTPLPGEGVISIVGPGTGLGVAQLWRGDGHYRVVPNEGGHIGLAPTDAFEDGMLVTLRARYGRVSAERAAAGPAISDIYAALGGADSAEADPMEDKSIWGRGLRGEDAIARQAIDRFCRLLGGIAGDLALAHGARGVVIAGGLGRRLVDFLPQSGFGERFIAKGRFKEEMERLPVKIVTYSEPGLYGAAAFFARPRRIGDVSIAD